MTTATAAQATRQELKPHRGVWSRADWLIVGALCGVAVLLPALVSLAVGSFSLPYGDDWAYRRSAVHFVQTGHVVLTGWSAMTLIGQLLWSWPFLRVFGDHGWVFGTSTAVLAVVGVSCAYYVARQVLARSWAAAAVLLVVATPGFVWNTSTFMTDMPTFAAEMACLALGVAALDRRGWARWSLLGGAMAVGVFGFSIREFAVAAPLAVLLCAGAGDSPRRRPLYLAAGVVTLVVCALIYGWSTHLPGYLRLPISAPNRVSVVRILQAYFTLAFGLSPAVAVAAWWRLRWRVSSVVATIVVIALGAFCDQQNGLLLGNYLAGKPQHAALLKVIALLSGVVLAGVAVSAIDLQTLRRWRSWAWYTPLAVVSVFGALFAAILVIYGLTNSGFYDRYLWPLAFAVGILLLRDPQPELNREWPRPVAGLIVALFGLIVVVIAAVAVSAATTKTAFWHAGQVAVANGVPPTEVDAGGEWVGEHATGIVNLSLHPAAPAYEPHYARIQPGFRDCAVVSVPSLNYPNLHLVKTTTYELLGFVGSRTLHIYISSARGC